MSRTIRRSLSVGVRTCYARALVAAAMAVGACSSSSSGRGTTDAAMGGKGGTSRDGAAGDASLTGTGGASTQGGITGSGGPTATGGGLAGAVAGAGGRAGSGGGVGSGGRTGRDAGAGGTSTDTDAAIIATGGTGVDGAAASGGTSGVDASGSGGAGGAAPSGNLCDGLVQDKVAHPMTALTKPGLLETVKDPQFGTTIRRITSVSTGVIKPLYSPTQAWSAGERYLLLYQVGHGHKIYDGKTYAFIKDVVISPPDIEQVYWDTSDSDIFYYIDGLKLIRYHVATDQKETYHTISNCTSSVGADSHAWMSWDAKYLGLQCNGTSFIYRIDTGAVSGSTTANSDYGAPSMGASGLLARWDKKVVDNTMKVVRTIDIPDVEHSSLGLLANGHDTYNAVQFDPGPNGSAEGTLVVHDMTDGTSRVIVGPKTGYPYPPGSTHVSAVAYRNPGWVFVSIVGNTSGQGILDQELLLANTNPGTPVVCRIGHHRSWGKEGPNDYWAEPHVTGSPTATRAVFGSDWGGGATVDTYVLELPSYKP